MNDRRFESLAGFALQGCTLGWGTLSTCALSRPRSESVPGRTEKTLLCVISSVRQRWQPGCMSVFRIGRVKPTLQLIFFGFLLGYIAFGSQLCVNWSVTQTGGKCWCPGVNTYISTNGLIFAWDSLRASCLQHRLRQTLLRPVLIAFNKSVYGFILPPLASAFICGALMEYTEKNYFVHVKVCNEADKHNSKLRDRNNCCKRHTLCQITCLERTSVRGTLL